MGKIIKITKIHPKPIVLLEDGVYNGIWGGSIIELTYKGENYELKTEEGVRGMGYKVVVIVSNGEAIFEEVKN